MTSQQDRRATVAKDRRLNAGMYKLVREYDWSATPGLDGDWPRSLRSVVNLVLASPVPMILLCGPKLIQIYNDGYAEIAGAKHPLALGQATQECWPEVWNFNAPIYAAVLDGEARSFKSQKLSVLRHGAPEDAWFDLSYSPVCDELGAITGILVLVVETTAQVRLTTQLEAEKEVVRRTNLELAAEGTTLRALFQQAPGFMCILRGPDHMFEIVNDAYSQLIGHRDVIGLAVRDALPEIEAEGQAFLGLLDGAYSTGKAITGRQMPLKVQRQSGSPLETCYLDFVYQPITDAAGRVTGLFVQGSDVTEAKLATDALRASEERMQSILSNAQIIGLWDWDVQRDLVRADERFAKLYGIDPAVAAAGVPVATFLNRVHVEDRTRMVRAAVHAAETNGLFASEYRLLRDDGAVRHLLTRGRCTCDAAGRPVHFLGVTIDITEQRHAEERLRMAQRAGWVGTFELDLAAQTLTVSEEFCRLWGVPVQAVAPLGLFTAMVHAADLERVGATHLRAPRDAAPYVEYRITRADTGAVHWMARRGEPRPETGGEATHLVGVVYDVTDRKRLEGELLDLNETLEARVAERTAELQAAEETLRQSQKMEVVGQLTGGIAHDFNNMLQAIGGALELMQRRVEQGRTAEAARYVDAARTTVDRAAALTNRLLAFARRQALQPKLVEPNALVEGMAELIRRTVGPSVEVLLRPADGIWTVLCDPGQLENVLLNLAVNARDAMPDGGRLTISTTDVQLTARQLRGQDDAKPGGYVEVAVADTGTGMTAAVLARAFEPFFTTKPLGQGTGLGLSQLYGFVRQSGGIVKLESSPGQGTTVRLYLPRHLGPAKPDTSGAEPALAATETFSGTVLVVEDEAEVRTMVAETLRELGCHVIEAHDGPSGLRVLHSREHVDLLVTDVGLPGLNGRQLADAARERRPNLPVLLITGYAGAALTDWQLAPGMEVVSKPFKLDTLAARVGSLLKQ